MCISNHLTSVQCQNSREPKERTDNNIPDKPFISKITCIKWVPGKYSNLYNQLYNHKIYDYYLIINYFNIMNMNNFYSEAGALKAKQKELRREDDIDHTGRRTQRTLRCEKETTGQGN